MHRTVAIPRRAFIAALCAPVALGQAGSPSSTEEAEVLKVEDAFRLAKLQNDIEALRRILADEYTGVNQYGARRDKAEVIELFRAFKLSSLTRAEADVRFAGGIAIVIGAQTEVNPAGREKLVFTRVYVKRGVGWQLLSSTQLISFNY
jgi:uncharacterized protein DUF4440